MMMMMMMMVVVVVMILHLSGVILKKLIGHHLVEKFSAYCGNHKFINATFHDTNRINPVRAFPLSNSFSYYPAVYVQTF
jgi:hypothetical protein